MSNDPKDEEQSAVFDEDDDDFVDLNHAVEVEVNEDDIPMDEDDEAKEEVSSDANAAVQDPSSAPSDVPQQQDMSIQTIASHKPSSVYTVASHLDAASNCLSILTGGGDDKAFLHKIQNNVLESKALDHKHTDSVSCVATNEAFVSGDLTKTPKYVAVGAYDGSIALYNPQTGEKIQALDGPTDVEFVSFHPKGGSVLLAGSISDATVWMYHLPTSKCLQVFVGHECNGDGGGVTCGSFTPDGKFALTVGMDGTMRVWAPRTGVCRHVFKFFDDGSGMNVQEGRGLTCLATNGGLDGQLAITGGEDGSARVVHLQGKKIVATLPHFDSNNSGMDVDEGDDEMMMSSVEAVSFASKSVNPNWVATGGSDGKLKVWDLTHDGGQCRQTCEVKASEEAGSETGGITRLAWHPTLPIIIASYTDGVVRLWDARNGNLIHSVTGDSDSENQINDMSIQFLASGTGSGSAVIVTAVDNGNAKVFNVDIDAVLNSANQQS